jgi:hypothetical protein
MGADLARGQVVGETLQCPLHHWRYGVEGRCTHIPASTIIPARARQRTLVCVERYGLVFGWPGDEPAFALPRFSGEGAEVAWSPPSATAVEAAHHVLVANSFDEQHFATVHDRALLAPVAVEQDGPYRLTIGYRARVVGRRLGDRLMRTVGIKTVGIEIHCWGGNLMYVYNAATPNTILVALLPVDAEHSRVFVTTVAVRPAAGLGRLFQRMQLTVAHRLTLGFLRPDMAVLERMELRPRVLLPEADRCFLAWLRYWQALPRAGGQPQHNGFSPVSEPPVQESHA